MTNKISHSKLNVYKQCSQKYFYKYVQRLDSPEIGSALVLGVAVDETLNYALQQKQKNESIDKEKLWKIYKEKMTFWNKLDIRYNMDTYYFKSDLTYYLFTNEDIDYFSKLDSEFIDVINKSQKDQKLYTIWFKQQFPEEAQYLHWLSMYRKGELMINTFLEKIMHKFNNVFFVQDNLEIDNGEGDILICKPDFGIIMTGQEIIDDRDIQVSTDLYKVLQPDVSYKIIMDNKTSANPYPDNAVRKSEQLHTYSEFYNANLAGYVVFEKNIRKDKVLRWQIMIDLIDKDFQVDVFQQITDGLHNMKQNIFERNPSQCYAFNRKCEFYDLCNNNEMGRLTVREERK